jgi:hypothetical protein
MAFEWKDYIDLAQFLQQEASGKTNGEAYLRSAISRTYYGAFCHVRDYAEAKLGFQAKGEAQDHGALRARIRVGKTKGISDRLDRMRQWRNDCDYLRELTFNLDATLATALMDAQWILASLPPASSTPGS